MYKKKHTKCSILKGNDRDQLFMLSLEEAVSAEAFVRVEGDGEFRKRIIFEDWFDEFRIEGIGSSTGSFRPFENVFASDIGWELLCLEEDFIAI